MMSHMLYNKIPNVELGIKVYVEDNISKILLTIANEYGTVSKIFTERDYHHHILLEYVQNPTKMVEEKKAWHCERFPTTTYYVLGMEFNLPLPPRKADVKFAGTVPTNTSFCDRQGNRDRNVIGYVYCRNNVYIFTGQDMPGKVMVTSSDYTKNGKWSNTSYELLLAPGYKFASKMQDFSSGKYVDDLKSTKSVAQDLNLEGVTDEAVCRFLYCNLPMYWVRFCDFAEKRDAIFDATGCDSMVDFDYNHADGTKRQGFKYLLVDGEVWHRHMNPMPEKVIMEDWTSRDYKLKIASNCEVEELYEWNYGDDCMESRGYIRVANELGQDPYMVTTAGNSPFADLLSRFK